MRLIDKDKTLEELNGGYEQSLGIIEGSRYSNINDIEDAINTVKYADEIDIAKHDSELLEDVWKKVISKDEDYLYLSELREIITKMKAEVQND